MFSHVPGDPIPITVGSVTDPDGRWRVLLQLPSGFVLLSPADADTIGRQLRDAAEIITNVQT